MHDIYGEPKCAGTKGFVPDGGHAPPGFCQHSGKDFAQRAMARQAHPKWQFDNYAMERVMLGKWLASPLLCEVEGSEPGKCGADRRADVVIVPSMSLHYLLAYDFTWPSFYKQTRDMHRKYWNSLAATYLRPGRMPLLVIHFPFCFHSEWSVVMLRALSEQPARFVKHVVIASLEGNLFLKHRHFFPSATPSRPEVALMGSSEGHNGTEGAAAPLLISLPYPTSILEAVNFSEDAPPYSANRTRPIAVSLVATFKQGSKIRDALFRQMNNRTMVCASGGSTRCGFSKPTEWDIAVNSAFCMEPPGDTLTRANFYIAVLSGCIPVIFDGGHSKFKSEPTQWAWRSIAAEGGVQRRISEPFVDYREFAVIFDASDVLDKNIDVIGQLVDMPKRDPQRFLALRKGLDRVAPLMTYAMETCSGQCTDAFSSFQSILEQALASRLAE